MSVEYGDGTVFNGVLAYAPVTVAGVATPGPIAFHLVKSVTCDPSVPDCPGRAGITAYLSGVSGIAGVGMRMHPGAPDLVSVLMHPAHRRCTPTWCSSAASTRSGRSSPSR